MLSIRVPGSPNNSALLHILRSAIEELENSEMKKHEEDREEMHAEREAFENAMREKEDKRDESIARAMVDISNAMRVIAESLQRISVSGIPGLHR